MIVNEIYLWGAALVAIIVVIAMIALAFVDSKMLRRMLVIFRAKDGHCPRCDGMVRDEDHYCSHCGEKL